MGEGGSEGPGGTAGGGGMKEACLGREALDFRVGRLSWPVPFVRWRAARALRDLVDAPATRTEATDQLLRCLASARCESEVCTIRSEEHTSELQSLMRISYAVFCLNKNKEDRKHTNNNNNTQDK